jgi:hypothetical protein
MVQPTIDAVEMAPAKIIRDKELRGMRAIAVSSL